MIDPKVNDALGAVAARKKAFLNESEEERYAFCSSLVEDFTPAQILELGAIVSADEGRTWIVELMKSRITAWVERCITWWRG